MFTIAMCYRENKIELLDEEKSISDTQIEEYATTIIVIVIKCQRRYQYK